MGRVLTHYDDSAHKDPENDVCASSHRRDESPDCAPELADLHTRKELSLPSFSNPVAQRASASTSPSTPVSQSLSVQFKVINTRTDSNYILGSLRASFYWIAPLGDTFSRNQGKENSGIGVRRNRHS